MAEKGADKKSLVNARGYIKSTLTRCYNYAESEQFKSSTTSILKAKRQMLLENYKEYEKLNKAILFMDASDSENVEEFEEKFIFTLAKFNDSIDCQLPDTLQNATCLNNPTAHTKLPHIEISNFDGKYSEYQQFINIFDSVIHNNTNLDNVQKLYYLRNFVKGEPFDIIKNLPICKESYIEALNMLKSRYNNKFLIMNDHISHILDVDSVKSNSVSIREFVSKIKQQIVALKCYVDNIESWDPILICILSRKLDSYTAKSFQMDRDSKKVPTLAEFLDYLEKRALALESVNQVHTSYNYKPKVALTTASTSAASCTFCKLQHKLFNCPKFKLSSASERIEFIKNKQLCKICLNLHSGKCKYHFRCKTCNKPHNTLLHMDMPVAPVALASNGNSHTLLPTVKVKLLRFDGTELLAKALLDSGSQVSFVTNKLVTQLSLTPKESDINIIGIANTNNNIKFTVPIEVYSCLSPFRMSINCNVVDTITCQLPQYKLESFKLPSGIHLADDEYNIPSQIDLLLGCDVFFKVLLPPQLQYNGNNKYPGIINTHFGHVIAGSVTVPIQHNKYNNKVTSLLCTCHNNMNNTLKEFWKTEEVPEIFIESTPESELCHNIFKNSFKLINKQFQVDLPLKLPLMQVNEYLGDSFNLALNRFLNLEKKLTKSPLIFNQYKNFIQEIIQLGHGQYIDIKNYNFNKDPIYFLPHHHVVNECSKTTKLRVVFDGSMKTNKKVSLNDILLNGPVIQRDLFDIILLFRLGKHMFIADIRRMFRNIKVNPLHASLQNILWRENPTQEIQCIKLNTVIYGLKSSSYLAIQCLDELATRYETELPLAASIVRNAIYVDDILYSDNDEERLLEAKQQIIVLLQRGGFSTHKWSSNSNKILHDITIEEQYFDEIELEKQNLTLKTLGLKFNIRNDNFVISCPQSFNNKVVTKREILSYISKFYDPLGFISPIIIKAKGFIQRLWAAKISWDSPLTSDLMHEWLLFANKLTKMPPIALPRSIDTQGAGTIQLIGFADASSSLAYGCCIYLRLCRDNGKACSYLLCSKSRLNPLEKPLTIPRLELNAVLLLSKLMLKVQKAISIKVVLNNIFLFTDSKIVLAWLQTPVTKLNAYVANRIKVISDITSNWRWLYVNSQDNPADCITRGLDPQELVDNTIWWYGPAFLENSKYTFDVNTMLEIPTCLPETKLDHHLPEVTALPLLSLSSCVASTSKDKFDLFERYSDLHKLIRIVAYILRFNNNCKTKDKNLRIKTKYLSTKELQNSLLSIIRHEQNNYFSVELQQLKNNKTLNDPLKSLHPFIDQKGLLRVGGRLHNANISYSQKHPIILPKDSFITYMIIHSEHKRLLHANAKLLLSSLNQKYWITNATRLIKNIVHRCTTCFRLKAEASKQLMGSLPADRVIRARPFQKVGMDFAGPISVKVARIRRPIVTKGYICLFICFTTKAVHIELVSDLTTATFLACFKRFTSRRGLPNDVYCDTGSTFKGARNQLADLYKLYSSSEHHSQVTSYAAHLNINFHFIPSYSPVFGGLWEAAVKSTKFHLKRIIGNNVITYEEMYTVLTQIEAVLNSRPLIPLSSNPDDFTYLTPGHFLTGSALVSYPDHDVSEVAISRLKLWNITKHMVQSFWNIWHKNYLNLLQSRPKWKGVLPNIKVGDLVLLKEDKTPPLTWPMARITKVFPGKDSVVRAFEVVTPNHKKHIRSITKVCLLPIEN